MAAPLALRPADSSVMQGVTLPPVFVELSTDAPPPSPEPKKSSRADGNQACSVEGLEQMVLFDPEKLCEKVRVAFGENLFSTPAMEIETMEVDFPVSLCSSADSSPPVRFSPSCSELTDRPSLDVEVDFMRRRSSSLKRLREPCGDGPDSTNFINCERKRVRTLSDSADPRGTDFRI